MCTVSLIPTGTGEYSLGFNRDEQTTRIERPPSVCGERRRHLAPGDSESGGAWIAVNDAGLAFALLNRTGPQGHGATGGVSRGLIVPCAAECARLSEVAAVVEAIASTVLRCFRLIATDGDGILEVIGGAGGLEHGIMSLTRPFMRTSSGLGDHLVQPPRTALFESEVAAAKSASWPLAQRNFHAHRWSDRRHLSVLMDRPGARTVSQNFRSSLGAPVGSHMTAEQVILPCGLDIAAGMGPWIQGAVLMLGTFILEDMTAVTAGLLAHAGVVPMPVALIATGLGIFLGDLCLYAIGAAAARGVRAARWVERRLPADRIDQMSRWFADSGWKAVVFSRFVSGTRLPVYLAAGFVGAGVGRFALWTFFAVLAWTSVVVGGTAMLGTAISPILAGSIVSGPLAWIAFVVAVLAVMQLSILAVTRRRTLWLALLRIVRFEFWPSWCIYLPLLPFFVRNAVRFGFVRTLTAVNPCWPDSGVIGESKQAGLHAFDPVFVSPSFRVVPDTAGGCSPLCVEQAIHQVFGRVWSDGWSRPIVVKPDAGQRGLGVKVVGDEDAFRRVLGAARAPVIVQRYEPGACEVGLFFIRDPGTVGRLFSICEKRFPHVRGDGRSTLRELIARDGRLRLQERVFFIRLAHRLEEVVPADHWIRLGEAGNHSQGCMFLDGERLRTQALEAWLVNACALARGFNYGRLDVRFPSEEACMRGEAGVILEVNGVSSESTNMYDPSFGAVRAWGVMMSHWRAAFRIGAENRRRGIPGVGCLDVLRRHLAWRATAVSGRDAIAD